MTKIKKSHVLIAVVDDKVLIIKRRAPYSISDMMMNRKTSRTVSNLERQDVLSYFCGKCGSFEDMIDFPKGRGSGIADALRECHEETGYVIQQENIIEIFKDTPSYSYVGYDGKKYGLIVHVIFLKKLPRMHKKGENLFVSMWWSITKLLHYFGNTQDNRGKSNFYETILKEIDKSKKRNE